MELKPGYKQTEVGVIPEDWDVQTMATLAKITTGPFGTLLKASEYSGDGSGVPLVSVGEVRDGYIKITEHTPRVPPTVIRRLPQYVLRTGDIVFGRKGAVDRSALITKKEEGYFLGSDGISVRLSGPCSPIYASCQLRSHRIRSWLLQNAIGTTMASLNQGILKKIPLGLPPRPEQEAIASALSDIDGLIEGLDKLISKKQGIKQAAMQELLTGKRRLPGFEGKWETVAISQVAEKITGFWGRTEPGSEAMHSTSVIRAGDISEDGRLIGEARRYLSHHESSLAGCRTGDTVMTASGNGLGKSWTCDQDGVYSASNFVRIIRPQRGKADGYFVGFALKSRRARSKLVEHTATSAYPNLKPSFFNDKWLSLPPEPEQKAISDVLRDIDIEIIELEARKLKAAQLKQGMMQQLLTGKIRLI